MISKNYKKLIMTKWLNILFFSKIHRTKDKKEKESWSH
jgi:hypothetical protein